LSGEGEAAGAGVVAGGAGRVGGGAWRGWCGGGISGAAHRQGLAEGDRTRWNKTVQPPCQHVALAARRKARPARERDGGIGAFMDFGTPAECFSGLLSQTGVFLKMVL
jgi:hypothetical protein